jgi:hypothetical protein
VLPLISICPKFARLFSLPRKERVKRYRNAREGRATFWLEGAGGCSFRHQA